MGAGKFEILHCAKKVHVHALIFVSEPHPDDHTRRTTSQVSTQLNDKASSFMYLRKVLMERIICS